MAITYPTLAQALLVNDKNALDLGISDISNAAPVLASLPMVKSTNGSQHKYIKLTAAPSAATRAANTTIARTFGTRATVTVDLDYSDATHIVDILVAKGYSADSAAYIAYCLPQQVRSALFAAESKVITNLLAEATMDALADTTHVIDAGGTTANTGSTVIAVRAATDGFQIVSNGGQIEVGDTVTNLITDSTGSYDAYVTPIGGFFGYQLGSVFDAARIVNLTNDSGKGLTDALISKLYQLALPGMPFTHLVMSRRSLGQLQRSRTATSPTGAEAPIPEVVLGMKILVTDAVSDTLALTA